MPADPSAVVPLRGPVLSSLAMAWAWGVIAGSVGLNALIKSNQQKSHLRKSVPRPTIVTIDTDDVFQSGVVLTVVGALIAVLCSLSLLALLVPHRTTRRLSARSLRLQSVLLAFCAAWLFATLVPFTTFFANRSAEVSASVGGVQLPQSIIKQAEQALGTTSVYKRIGYLRLVAILPWITLLFTVVAAGVLFVAGSPARRAQPDRATHDSSDDEKGAAAKA